MGREPDSMLARMFANDGKFDHVISILKQSMNDSMASLQK